jgi:ribosomal protein L20
MQKTVYFLAHRDTGQRLRYYRTLAGARIAQRARNHRLGFRDRVERVLSDDNWEVERCELADGAVVDATWCIEEGCVDQEDITECE